MTHTQIVLAGLAAGLWIGAYSWYFHNDLRSRLRWRAAMRKQALELRREQAAQQAKLIEELAERYQLPPSGPAAHA